MVAACKARWRYARFAERCRRAARRLRSARSSCQLSCKQSGCGVLDDEVSRKAIAFRPLVLSRGQWRGTWWVWCHEECRCERHVDEHLNVQLPEAVCSHGQRHATKGLVRLRLQFPVLVSGRERGTLEVIQSFNCLTNCMRVVQHFGVAQPSRRDGRGAATRTSS